MDSAQYVPDNPERDEWDVVVVGTGMGGATLGYELAKRGRQVLFVEKGRFLFGGADRGDGRIPTQPDNSPDARLERGWWPFPLQGDTTFGKLEFFAPLGCGSGGTSGLYAAQLERFNPSDLRPSANHPGATDATLPESWPISYEELVPYYRQAEALYRVCGTPDPLNPDPDANLREPPPLSPRDQDLHDSFVHLGLHPYRAHVGYEFIAGCGECGGALCPKSCKKDAGSTCLMPALEQHGASILPESDVLRLEADGSKVTGVVARRHGREVSIRARVVVLAAGAFNSPVILLRSTSSSWPDGLGNRSGLVGRNLMLHVSDFVAVRPTRPAPAGGPQKALALNDFYFCDGRKLGTFQSVGIPVTPGYVMHYLRSTVERKSSLLSSLAKPALRGAAYAGATYYKHAAVFATIVEDLPYHGNRVWPDARAASGFRFEYRYTDELRERSGLFRRRLAERLAAHRVAILTGDNNLNFGHVCGTCRFGEEPSTSVLDRNNRVHDVENLYVVDSSCFPSSSGTNPSLTIAANALRVASSIGEG